ncbi:hypothetical protein DM02DRAFT_538717 [Periconia macrospinosa]|uniref:Rhodopsin domain-containing protein n=1 Tax=Periconia macrospinosa TaxID=97972 RepID=A0A2V1D9R7_9PLEO|nr:hypothetical protein DM02DRAFT_538717 [Periconia macrospinosa]
MAGLPPGINLTDDKQPQIIGSVSATWALATLAIMLRFLCRRISKANLWWDDYLMIPAYIFTSIVSWVTLTYMIFNDFGKHIFIQPPQRIPVVVTVFLKSLFIAEVCYTGTIVFAKFSILAFYWRLFKMNTLVRHSIVVLATIVSMWGIAVFVIVVTQCRPLEGFWDKTIKADCTVDSYKFFYGNSTPNIITDILLMLAPLPAIWTLHLEFRQKVSLSGIFLLGIFVTAVSITRLVFLVSLNIADPDVTWVFIDPQIWTCVELNIAVVCGCLPQLRPLLLLITTGSAAGTKVASKRQSKDTIGSYKKSPWGSRFSTKENAAGLGSVSDGKPFVAAGGENAKYIRLGNLEGKRDSMGSPGRNEKMQVNVETEWTVSSQRS